jgi:hypothetical protein
MPASQRRPASAARLAGRPAAQLAGRLAAPRNQRPKCPTVSTHVSRDRCSRSKIGARSGSRLACRVGRCCLPERLAWSSRAAPGIAVGSSAAIPAGRESIRGDARSFALSGHRASTETPGGRSGSCSDKRRPHPAQSHPSRGVLGTAGPHWLIHEQVFTHPSRKYTLVHSK